MRRAGSRLETWLTRAGAFSAAVLTTAGGFWATWQQAAPVAHFGSFRAFDSTWLWFIRFFCTPFLSAGFRLGLRSPLAFAVELILGIGFWSVLFDSLFRRIRGRPEPAEPRS